MAAFNSRATAPLLLVQEGFGDPSELAAARKNGTLLTQHFFALHLYECNLFTVRICIGVSAVVVGEELLQPTPDPQDAASTAPSSELTAASLRAAADRWFGALRTSYSA